MKTSHALRTSVRPWKSVLIASAGLLLGLPVHAQDAPSAPPSVEAPAAASDAATFTASTPVVETASDAAAVAAPVVEAAASDPATVTEPVIEAAPVRPVPVVDAQPMRRAPSASETSATDLLAPESTGLTAAAAHDAALEAALHRASEAGNPNATVVWGEAPEAAHAAILSDAQGLLFQVGEASWYGADFAGLPTASGEIYDMYAYTVAHPSWPLGSIVRVENVHNGRLVLARVNDRGPFAMNRILDCSMSIAQSLGFLHAGHTRVRVTLLDSAPDAWTRFEGFRAPVVAAQPASRLARPGKMMQAEAMMALTEDTAPEAPVIVAVAEAESSAQSLVTFRAASVLPYPAIAHAWDSLSRWLLGPAGESTRWHHIETAVDRFGLRGFVRMFTRL